MRIIVISHQGRRKRNVEEMLFYLFGFFQDAKGELNLRKAEMPIHIRSMKLCWIVGMRKSWRQRAANNNFSVPMK
jgi:hypothetical protein